MGVRLTFDPLPVAAAIRRGLNGVIDHTVGDFNSSISELYKSTVCYVIHCLSLYTEDDKCANHFYDTRYSSSLLILQCKSVFKNSWTSSS